MASGKRVWPRRQRRSSRTSSGTWIVNGRTSMVVPPLAIELTGSEGREAPIDEQTGACDVRGVLGRQKQDTRGHFLGRARPFEHGAGTGLGPVIVQGFAG